MSVRWFEWSEDTLLVARDERRPVLLFLNSSWSRYGAMLEATTLADAAVATAVGTAAGSERVVCVRADVESQPELAARYGQGGFPSLVLIGTDGETLSGGTFLEPARLVALIDHAVRRCSEAGFDDPPPAAPPVQCGDLDDELLPTLEQALLSHFDPRHGGFGGGQKFPHAEALDFAILRLSEAALDPDGERRAAGDRRPRLREVVETTLDHMLAGELHDRVGGGFFRYCARSDWTRPNTEKRLETNADLLRNAIEAGQVLGREDYLAVGESVVALLERDLRDPEVGLFHASLAPDDEYYALDAAGRAERPAPVPDGRFLADANARAISALLKAGAVLRRPDVTALALSTTRTLLDRLWRPGRGMRHSYGETGSQGSGLLRDQVETARALQHVLQYTDDRRYGPALEDLLERIASDHVTSAGEFANVDRVRSGKLPRRRDHAILESAAAAEVLLRGSMLTGRTIFAELARRALELHAGDYRRYGYSMAAYGRAVELLLHPPLHLIVVGDGSATGTAELFEAASTTYLPSRVVQRLDPDTDGDVLARLGLPRAGPPTVFVFLARDGAAAHTDPATLGPVLAAANARRLRC